MKEVLNNLVNKDPSKMYIYLEDSPNQLVRSYEASKKISLPKLPNFNSIYFYGMGSSGTAAEIVASWLEWKVDKPVSVIRNHISPNALKNSLNIVVSKSGDTVETIKLFQQALEFKNRVICVTCGGKLRELAEENNVPCLKVESTPFSRTTTFSLIGGLIAILEKALSLSEVYSEVRETHSSLRRLVSTLGVYIPTSENEVKQLALKLMGKNIHILATYALRISGLRLLQQLNENSKIGAYLNVIPEALHNYIMQRRSENDAIILIKRQIEDEFTEEAVNQLINKITPDGCPVFNLIGEGRNYLTQILTSILKADYLSYYLAIALGVDPSDTTALNQVKSNLKKRFID